jgi:hypothetical protein
VALKVPSKTKESDCFKREKNANVVFAINRLSSFIQKKTKTVRKVPSLIINSKQRYYPLEKICKSSLLILAISSSMF